MSHISQMAKDLSPLPPADTRDARFACHCCGVNWIDHRLEHLVEQLEIRTGGALVITSGYRCKKHNKKVGGSPTSSHLGGLAVDIACEASPLRFRILQTAVILGFARIGIYKNFIHLDIDRAKAQEVIWYG